MMNKSIVLIFSIVIAIGANAQQKNNEWHSLFNGKDLTGFKQLEGNAKYQVKGEEIIGTTVFGEKNSFLATDNPYGDFILELDLKLSGNMNSGIQFRSEVTHETNILGNPTEGEVVYGYQMEIDPSARAWSGGIYDESRRGWLYSLEYNTAAKKAFKPTDWNHYRIECIGNTMRTWVNGIPCAYLIDDKTASGFIALQVHSIEKKEDAGKEIHWKNIRIQTKNLKASPSDKIFVVNLLNNNLSEEENSQGYKLLWDGKTSTGWRGAHKNYFPDKIWTIADGELTVGKGSGAESSNGGDIVTQEEFAAFDLQFEFKMSDTANSGVKYYVTENEKNSGSAIGLEYQILDDDKHPDAKEGSVGNRTLSSLYDLIPAAPGLNPLAPRRDKLPIGQWNRGRIVAYPDGKVEHWLNGWKMVEYQRGTPIYNALVARSKYKQWENFGMASKGRILLQEHGTKVSFRSIKIKEL
jgi:hypothetical protein